jgi:hypothetical protein
MKYYFLVTYLPEIGRDDKRIKLRVEDLLEEQYYIAPRDRDQIELVLLARDMLLLERLMSGKDVDVPLTLYGKEFWREQMKAPREVPPFLEEFLQNATAEEFGPGHVDQLQGLYYDHVLEKVSSPLLRDYFCFEKDVRNILAAIRARKLGRPPSEHILADAEEPGELEEQLGRSNAEDFGLGQQLPWVERLVQASDPMALEDGVEQVFWDYLEEKTTQVYFDFDLVLAYLLKLQLLEKRLALSDFEGMELVRQLEGF